MSRTQTADRGVRTLREQWEEDGVRVGDEVSGILGARPEIPVREAGPQQKELLLHDLDHPPNQRLSKTRLALDVPGGLRD